MSWHRSSCMLPLLAMVLAACSGSPESEIETDSVWSRVEAEGRLVVGTAANYPPFAYYDDELDLTGFDVALMNAVGDELGLAIEFHDFAFDGLGDALKVGQIDAAIAAITVTGEREAVVDFSHPYHVGSSAALVREGDAIESVAAVEERPDVSIGVERGTVYESRMRQVVAEGRMPQANLFVYVDIGQAVRDLRDERVDVVVLDSEPAQRAAASGGLDSIDTGWPEEQYAIAVQDGASDLLDRINQALVDLAEEGVADELARVYLDAEGHEIVAVPTVEPAPAADEVDCVSSMELVEHKTYDHGELGSIPSMQPGAPFSKAWLVENTGTCPWGPGYSLSFAQGNVPSAEMGGESVTIDSEVAPGETYELAVDLVAPIMPGTYVGQWVMSDPDGQEFGEVLAVAVSVAALPTVTPPPTVPPDPQIAFTAEPTEIVAGERVLFAWDVKNATAVYFHAEGRPWQQHQVPHQAERVVWPNQTTVYFLRVDRADGATETRQITILVTPVVQAPHIDYFSVYPESQLPMGSCATIQWSVQCVVSQVALSANGAVLWPGAPLQGAMPHCPPGVGTMVYTIQAAGPGGTSSLSHQLEVVPTSAGAPTPSLSGPVVTAFSATPSRIKAGACVRLYWQVAGAFESITISRDTRVILDNAAPTGETTDCPGSAGTVSYGIKVVDSQGRSAQSQSTVLVE